MMNGPSDFHRSCLHAGVFAQACRWQGVSARRRGYPPGMSFSRGIFRRYYYKVSRKPNSTRIPC